MASSRSRPINFSLNYFQKKSDLKKNVGLSLSNEDISISINNEGMALQQMGGGGGPSGPFQGLPQIIKNQFREFLVPEKRCPKPRVVQDNEPE